MQSVREKMTVALDQLQQQRTLNLLARATNLADWAKAVLGAVETKLILLNTAGIAQAIAALRKELAAEKNAGTDERRIRTSRNRADRQALTQRLTRRSAP